MDEAVKRIMEKQKQTNQKELLTYILTIASVAGGIFLFFDPGPYRFFPGNVLYANLLAFGILVVLFLLFVTSIVLGLLLKDKRWFCISPASVILILLLLFAWITGNFDKYHLRLPQTERQKMYIEQAEEEGYTLLGDVRGEMMEDSSKKSTFNLFYTGYYEKTYYCSFVDYRSFGSESDDEYEFDDKYTKKYLVKRYGSIGKIEVGNNTYIIDYDFEWE